MNLYQIDSEIDALIDPETGEITDFEAFQQLNLAREVKTESLLLCVKNTKSDIAQIKEEINALTERKISMEAKLLRVTEYAKERLNGEKFESPRVKASFRKSSHVEIGSDFLPWAKLSKKYLRDPKPVEPEPDKVGIKKAIESGEKIPGVSIVTGYSLTIK